MNSRETSPLRVAIVGCGAIAGPYARDLASYPLIELIGVTDVDREKSRALSTQQGCHDYASLDELLDDSQVQLVVNLTTHRVHYDIIRQCLMAGKHVYTEKPLALNYAEASELVELARRNGLRLGSSPFTWLGEAQQTAWHFLSTGKLGTVRVVYAEVNWGRIESWHPSPHAFYEVGALWDVGVYPLAFLTAFYGPAIRVAAYGTVLKAERNSKRDGPFRIETPDFVVALIELADGPLIRLTTNFYVSQQTHQKGLEFHGDDGSLFLSNWMEPRATVQFAPYGSAYEVIPLPGEAPDSVRWGRGVLEMAEAMTTGRPHRTTGAHAAHVVDILCAASEAISTGKPVSVTSDFSRSDLIEQVHNKA